MENIFELHAALVDVDEACRRLSFADRNDENCEHYFIIDRSEESPTEALPDMGNVYIRRDDQCWGGYGGINQVVLTRDCLTVKLDDRMAATVEYDTIRVTFAVSDAEFATLLLVLRLIVRGYETKLVVADETSR